MEKAFLAVAPGLGVDVLKRYPVSGSCAKHGEYAYESVVPPRPGVSMCQACATERCAEIDKQVQLHARQAAHTPAALMNRLGTPRRYQGCILDSFRCEHPWQENAKATVIGIIERLRNDLYGGVALLLHGSVGMGKTHLACVLAHETASMGYRVRYVPLHELFAEFIHQDFAGKKAILDTEVLVVDEVLRQTSDAIVEFLRELIEARYNSMLPIILVGNYTPAELAAHLGTRCMDRLVEIGADSVPLEDSVSQRMTQALKMSMS